MKTILRGGSVFDSTTGQRRQGDVLIEGDRIVSVGGYIKGGSKDADVVDVTGTTIVAGLINMHEHLTMRRTWGPPHKQFELPEPYLVIRGVRGALASLRQGITTARELGAKSHMNVFLKRAIDFEVIPGPRVLAAGAPISVTGGHAWTLSTEADGAEGMRLAVRRTIKAGADWIKLISSNDPVHQEHEGEHTHPELNAEEFRVAVETAHNWGRKITAHAMGTRTIGWAIDAGIDSIEHGIYLDRPLAERMVREGVALIPTLSGYYETILDRWSRGPDWIARHKHLIEPHKWSVRIAIESGVQIGVGTDTVGDIVEEMQMLVECGMSSAQALTAATLTNAQILGLERDIGTVEQGKRADLVVVRGDPLVDLGSMRRVDWVFKAGKGARPADIGVSSDDESAEWTSLRIVEAH